MEVLVRKKDASNSSLLAYEQDLMDQTAHKQAGQHKGKVYG